MTGHPLKYTQFGKPHRATYEFASSALAKMAQSMGCETMDKVYAIGDNPSSDIKGANDFGWESILVRTGVWNGRDPSSAKFKADDIEKAVDMIFLLQGCVR